MENQEKTREEIQKVEVKRVKRGIFATEDNGLTYKLLKTNYNPK